MAHGIRHMMISVWIHLEDLGSLYEITSGGDTTGQIRTNWRDPGHEDHIQVFLDEEEFVHLANYSNTGVGDSMTRSNQ